jgi:hypothetical protein
MKISLLKVWDNYHSIKLLITIIKPLINVKVKNKEQYTSLFLL